MSELQTILNDTTEKKLVRDAFFGIGGFNDGAYLCKYDRETEANFMNRKKLAYYFNYTKPMVEGAVDPVFREYPARTTERQDSRWDAFLVDVDGRGTAIDDFMAKAALDAKLDGSVFIVVDNTTEVANNLKESVDRRLFPYLYKLKQANITNYVLDRFGNLILLEYQNQFQEVQNGVKRTVTESWKWTQEEWRLIKDGIETVGVNQIGVIPVVPLIGANVEEWSDNPLKPQSDFTQIAKVNRAIYNACSELRQRNRSQAFSMLTYPVPDGENPELYKDFVTGTNNALLYKGGSPPSWITPDQSPSDMLRNEIDMLVEGIYRMAERSSVTGVQSQTSGIAKEWDNFTRMQSISAFSKVCERAEERIATIFGLYINVDLGVIITYAKDFGITDTVAELDKITSALDLAIGGRFDTEVKKKAARLVLKDIEDADIQKVVEDIENRSDDADYSDDTE